MIFVDVNEPKEIYELLKMMKLPVSRRKNKINDEYDITVDYIIKVKKHEVAVERKTWEDLVASLEDGRYSLQRYVLYKFFPFSYLVIIGNWNNVLKFRKIKLNNLIGVLISTQLKTKGKVSVVQLNNHEEFALFLKLLHQTLEKEKLEVLPKPSVNKKDLNELKVMMLACIPGVGIETAKKLINKFGTIEKIVNASKAEITCTVGLVKAEKIWKFFRT